jgi:hypothetical protein
VSSVECLVPLCQSITRAVDPHYLMVDHHSCVVLAAIRASARWKMAVEAASAGLVADGEGLTAPLTEDGAVAAAPCWLALQSVQTPNKCTTTIY